MPFVALTEKVEVVFAVGVPEMVVVVPVVAVLRERPAGREPEARLQVKGPEAVVEAVRVWE